ncbi:MAG: extracellular solute-binding protein [Streptosporangiaceae bacterium]|jgi:raffinose/stachyose/melibiose transport system substrate-binding protein
MNDQPASARRAVQSAPGSAPVSRRRFMALGAGGALAAAAGSTLLSACASGTSSGKGSGSGISGTISFLSWDTLAISQPMVSLFQKKYPNVQVEVEFENPDTYVSTLATRLSSGTAPDIFIYTAQNKASLNAGNYVLDITDQDSTKVMAAANRNFMSDGDKVYGFSPASWASGPIWNLQLLDKVGGTPPATWDEFIEIGHKLKGLGVTPYSDASQLGTILEGLLGSYFTVQGLLAPGHVLGIEADSKIFSGQSTFAEEWLTPLEMYNQLYTEGLIPSSVVSLTDAEFDSELANGQLGALGSGPWDVSTAQQDNPKVPLKMLPVPGAKAGQEFWCGAPNQGWAIYSKSSNLDAATAFVNWLATPEALQNYAKLSGDIITTTNYESAVPSSLTETAEAARSSNYYFTGISWPTKYSEQLGDVAIAEVNLMIQGKASPQQVLAAMDTEVQKLRSA